MLDDAKILKIIKPIVQKALTQGAAKSMQIESDHDHDGEPIIRLTIVHRENAPLLDARAFLDSANTAMSALHDHGEDRFLHIRNIYSDGEPALDDEAPPPRRKGAA